MPEIYSGLDEAGPAAGSRFHPATWGLLRLGFCGDPDPKSGTMRVGVPDCAVWAGAGVERVMGRAKASPRIGDGGASRVSALGPAKGDPGPLRLERKQ